MAAVQVRSDLLKDTGSNRFRNTEMRSSRHMKMFGNMIT